MIVAANDVRDLHQRVVDHHHIVVNRDAGRAQDDGIAHHFVGELDHATHDVVEADGVLGDAQADGRSLAAGTTALGFGGVEHTTLARVDRRKLRLQLLVAVALQFLLRAEAQIRRALADQALGVFAINVEAIALAIGRVRAADVGTFVPVDAHPLHVFQKLGLEAGLAALDIGIFNAEDHRASSLPGDQPVEERGTGVADVQMSGG